MLSYVHLIVNIVFHLVWRRLCKWVFRTDLCSFGSSESKGSLSNELKMSVKSRHMADYGNASITMSYPLHALSDVTLGKTRMIQSQCFLVLTKFVKRKTQPTEISPKYSYFFGVDFVCHFPSPLLFLWVNV